MTVEAAIPQDVEVKEVVVGNTARNDMLASIAERARQERDQEMKASGQEPVDTMNIEVKEEKEPETEIKNEEKQEEIKEIEPVIETVKIKVDGEEKEVPKDKIYDAGIRALQKESAADKRLEEATRLLREAKEYAQPQVKEAPPPEWDDATVAYALEHGDEAQKAYAVSQMRGRDTTTPDELIRQTTQKVLDNVDFQTASEWFLTEYSDIAKDPYLFQLAGMAEDKARANGDNRPRKELYKEIGNDLRKWKGGNTVQTLEEKKELKANIVNLPSASVKKSTPAEAKPETPSDVIERMRKARGQR
jgi:hypothetical protein